MKLIGKDMTRMENGLGSKIKDRDKNNIIHYYNNYPKIEDIPITNEEWMTFRKVSGYHYKCSTSGRISVNGRLCPTSNTNGYKQVGIKHNLRRGSRHFVHRIICEAFHGKPKNNNMIVRHLDGNKKNNKPENLRWRTQNENSNDTSFHRYFPMISQNNK